MEEAEEEHEFWQINIDVCFRRWKIFKICMNMTFSTRDKTDFMVNETLSKNRVNYHLPWLTNTAIIEKAAVALSLSLSLPLFLSFHFANFHLIKEQWSINLWYNKIFRHLLSFCVTSGKIYFYKKQMKGFWLWKCSNK